MDESLERCILYSNECPEGQIFEGEAIGKAKEDGWKEVPPIYEGDAPVEEAKAVAQSEVDALEEMLTETNVTLQETKNELAAANDQVEALKGELDDANYRIGELEAGRTEAPAKESG